MSARIRRSVLGPEGPAGSLHWLISAVCVSLAALGRTIRLIRAYNELRLMNHATLRSLGRRPGDIDLVLQGRWSPRGWKG